MNLSRSRQGSALVLVIALVAIVAGGLVGWMGWQRAPEQFYYSYLVAWLFWVGISLGSLSLVLLHNLTGGKWGELIRPILRAAASVLPLMGILLLPIMLQPEKLYEWAQPSHVEHDPILQHKAKYLNVGFFQLRTAVYFAIWIALLAMLSWQARVSPLPNTAEDRRFRRFSGQGLGLCGIAITFASIDWVMSLEPHWFSTIYGVIWFGSWGLAALAFANVLAGLTARRMTTIEEYHRDSLHDLGKLMLGFTMFWAYVAFSQFFIIWNGNLPEEVVYYERRLGGGWKWVALAVVVLHFALPFAMLLPREAKRNPTRLAAISLLLLVAEWIAVVWQVEPAVHLASPAAHTAASDEHEAGPPEPTPAAEAAEQQPVSHGDSGELVSGETTVGAAIVAGPPLATHPYMPWLDLGLTAGLGGVWWIAFMILLPRMTVRVTAGSGEVHHG